MNEQARSRRARPVTPPRDQDASTFTVILERLLATIPGSRGAVLVDSDGETVDYAGILEPFDLKIAAAHWQIVIAELRELEHFSEPRQITVRARNRGYIVRRLPEGYGLLLVLHARAAFAASERAIDEIEANLCSEAGWDRPAGSAKWFRVDVETLAPDHIRPHRMWAEGAWQTIEVLGTMVGLRPREKGFRVRLASGAEMSLVRECRRRWFADEHVEPTSRS
ncbi:MAG TPA: roadblock/LC7 domain-containing protein [Polyangium sp.]|nr:roadblock/LC7 domain-containing protein [Polyangium sp.]